MMFSFFGVASNTRLPFHFDRHPIACSRLRDQRREPGRLFGIRNTYGTKMIAAQKMAYEIMGCKGGLPVQRLRFVDRPSTNLVRFRGNGSRLSGPNVQASEKSVQASRA
jgi:hypothetical protein